MDKRERVARAICSGISGPTICRDVSDCSYCMNAAQAAIAALEPVTVQEAARVLLDAQDEALQSLDFFSDPKESPLLELRPHWLRALAERGE